MMTQKEHIKNHIKSIAKGDMNEGEEMEPYLERKCNAILNYVPSVASPSNSEEIANKKGK